MKILIVCEKTCTNPFVTTLAEALNKQEGVEAVCSCRDFFAGSIGYDVILFQWPEAVYDWKHHISDDELRTVDCMLRNARENNKIVAITCHNLKPHSIQDANICSMYDVVYSYVDIFLHMGEYSMMVMKPQYPKSRHILVPHHVYDNLYKNMPTRNEACCKLGLQPDWRYILSLGSFRNEEEKNLVKYVACHLPQKVALIAPSLYFDSGEKRFSWKRFKYYCDTKFRYSKSLIAQRGFIADNDVPFYLAVSDVTFIQRLSILNSGNLPLGMYAGNVIVGPDVGNVGDIIRHTDNLAFSINNKEQIPALIEEALNLYHKGKGQANRELAQTQWASHRIAQMICDALRNFRN